MSKIVIVFGGREKKTRMKTVWLRSWYRRRLFLFAISLLFHQFDCWNLNKMPSEKKIWNESRIPVDVCKKIDQHHWFSFISPYASGFARFFLRFSLFVRFRFFFFFSCVFQLTLRTYEVLDSISPFSISRISIPQLHWNIYPICYLPERERRTPISGLDNDTLEMCIEFTYDERNDVAGMSENILLANGMTSSVLRSAKKKKKIEFSVVVKSFRFTLKLMTVNYHLIAFSNFKFFSLVFLNWLPAGGVNVFALIGGIGCIVMAVLIVFIILSVRRHSAKYYTNEDKRNGEFFIQFCGPLVTDNFFDPIRFSWFTHLQMDCTRKIWTHCQSPAMKSVSNFLWTKSYVRLTRWRWPHHRSHRNHHWMQHLNHLRSKANWYRHQLSNYGRGKRVHASKLMWNRVSAANAIVVVAVQRKGPSTDRYVSS